MKIKITITDDQNKTWAGEANLVRCNTNKLSNKKPRSYNQRKRVTYRELIIGLIDDGFFKSNRTMAEIIKELETRDYHLKSSQLTSTLRNIVRNKHLKKTKNLPTDKESKRWTYVNP